MNRKQCWNMWILEYLLNSLPQVIYQHILKRLNKTLYWQDTCGSPCDSNKQLGWGCVSNHGEKPCNLQGETVSSQGSLDKRRLVQHPVRPDGSCLIVEWLSVHERRSAYCVAQMGVLNKTEPLSDNYTVQAQSAND